MFEQNRAMQKVKESVLISVHQKVKESVLISVHQHLFLSTISQGICSYKCTPTFVSLDNTVAV